MRAAFPVAISDLTGREVSDRPGLLLANAPAYVCRQNFDGETALYTLVLGQALGRRALMDLLYALAPYKAHGPDRFARVLDNWGLHDRARAGGASQNLFLQHVNSLKSSWSVFAEHRELFIEVFKDETESMRVAPVLAWEKRSDGGRRWRFNAIEPALLQVIQGSMPFLRELESAGRLELDALVGLVTIPYLVPELTKRWPAWKPLVKDGKSNYIGPASVPMMALLHRRALLNSSLIRAVEALDFNQEL